LLGGATIVFCFLTFTSLAIPDLTGTVAKTFLTASSTSAFVTTFGPGGFKCNDSSATCSTSVSTNSP
jgi:hypothetical protein